ncbi:MAG: hypothetical protein ACK55I_32380, partial [bacterium]
RLALAHPRLHPGIERQHVVLARLHPPLIDQRAELLGIGVREIGAFREIFGDVIEFPFLGGQRLRRQRTALRLLDHRLPAIGPERARPYHLVILHTLARRRVAIGEAVREADAFQ